MFGKLTQFLAIGEKKNLKYWPSFLFHSSHLEVFEIETCKIFHYVAKQLLFFVIFLFFRLLRLFFFFFFLASWTAEFGEKA